MSDAPALSDGRRSTRLALSVPIVLHGKDSQQKAFREDTHTLIVNKHGAKLVTSHELVIGEEILIENSSLGSIAKANVVWVSVKRNARGLHEVGVQLVESQNIWGLEYTPDDWTAEGKDQGAAAAKEAAVPRPTPVEPPPAQTPPPTLTSEQIATQILQDMHETADAHARQFSERLDQVVQRIGLEMEIDLRARAKAAKEAELSTIDHQILASSERLNALKGEMEELDAKLAESRSSLAATLDSVPPALTPEQLYEKIEADALPVLHLITEGGIAAARERWQVQAQADAAQALAAWRDNVHAERDSILEEARQQIMSAVNSALQTLDRERETGLKEMNRHILEEIEANKERVVLQIKSKLDVTAESHGQSLIERLNETVRETGEQQATLLQNQLDALLVTRLDQAQKHVQSVGESLQSSVEVGIRAAGEKSSQELQARLQEIADQIVASSSDQARKQVEESAREAAEKNLQTLQTRLQEIADQTVSSSSDHIRAQVEEAAQTAAEKSLQAWQTRLQGIADKALASTSDQIRSHVEELAHATSEKGLLAWQARLQEVANQSAASALDQIQGQINEALNLMGPRLQEIQERAVNDAVEAFRGRLSQFLGLLPSGGNK